MQGTASGWCCIFLRACWFTTACAQSKSALGNVRGTCGRGAAGAVGRGEEEGEEAAEEARATLYSSVDNYDAMKVSAARECGASNCAAHCGEDDTGSVCGGPSPCQARGDDITEERNRSRVTSHIYSSMLQSTATHECIIPLLSAAARPRHHCLHS